ncbi:MAG: nucleoside triphosphate pyrophosphohydrolase [Clostridia bacterium]|nr:nucleoside triphosphate pyrophosphohydrolase [Clostridia bacterium]
MADKEKWQELIDIMARLRGEGGCPWDRQQDHHSLKRYLLEEAYEVLDAIDAGDDAAFCDELGDVLLQIVFHAQIAAEQGRFTIDDVVAAISAKMIRRHPHIFGEASAENAEQVLTMWEEIKAKEKNSDGKSNRGLMKLNENLPALMLAQKAQEKAARVGFDWDDISGPRTKLAEELAELDAAQTAEERTAELGDVLFSIVNMARFLDIDAEDALRRCVRSFIGRCDYMDKVIAERGQSWLQLDLAELDQIWDEAKERQ